MIGHSALANALKDFGAPTEPTFEPMQFDDPMADAMFADQPGLFAMPAPETDVESLVADAIARTESEVSGRLEADHALRLAEERERHAQELAEVGGQIAAETSTRIAEALEEAEARLVELTTSVTARILGIALTDDIRERSIDRLGALIRDALRDDEAVRIRARGALSLYEALRQTLPERVAQLDFEEGPGFDLSIVIDDSIFETRLSEWSAALSEALT